MDLSFQRLVPMRRLPYVGPKTTSLPLVLDEPLDASDPERADQLVFEVFDTHVNPYWCDGRTAGKESAAEVSLLTRIAQPSHRDRPLEATEVLERGSDIARSPDGHDHHALGGEIPPEARRQRFDRALVARPFDENCGPQAGGVEGKTIHGARIAQRRT